MLYAYREAKEKFLAELKSSGKPLVCWICRKQIRFRDIWDFHHPAGRGTMEHILMFHPVHRACHDKVHAQPNWARENGFMFY